MDDWQDDPARTAKGILIGGVIGVALAIFVSLIFWVLMRLALWDVVR